MADMETNEATDVIGHFVEEPTPTPAPKDVPLFPKHYEVLVRHSSGPGRLIIAAKDKAAALKQAMALSNAKADDITVLGEVK